MQNEGGREVRMQNEGGNEQRNSFDMFGGLGNFGSFGGSIFGRNPFDDPFFTRPFGSMFAAGNTAGESRSHPVISPPPGPIITELLSDNDDDGDGDDIDDADEDSSSARPANEPFVDHPDDETDDNEEHANYKANYPKAGCTPAQSGKFHSCKVTYGGVDGVYYSSTATRRMGSDGVIMEECKEADKSKGEATHRISRGFHDKGHSVTRKLNSDGKVDTLQTLHNLNEDELGSFEEAWKSNRGSSSTGMDMLDQGRSLLPSIRNAPGTGLNNETSGTDSSSGRSRKVVRIPID